MTLREFSESTGVSLRTVQERAQAAGFSRHGKRTELTKMQVTALLETIKTSKTGGTYHKRTDGSSVRNVTHSLETPLTLDFQLALIERQARELNQKAAALWKQKALEQEARAAIAERLLSERESGLAFFQRAAEKAGAVMSDRDDLLSLYGRR